MPQIIVPEIDERFKGKSTSEKEEYIRQIIRETVMLNPEGVTISMLAENLPFDRKTIEKHLYALQFKNEVYSIRLGRTVLYLSNLKGAKKIGRKKIGERVYELSQVRNRNGEFILIRQLKDNNTSGGLLVPKEEFEEFVRFLARRR
ncbi:hypothetical protein DRP04_15670 [Archaeoglobales archaeon]|nr:MAG: hypothetical protein DRP04_15670 [Archaeoglobales archaeon]